MAGKARRKAKTLKKGHQKKKTKSDAEVKDTKTKPAFDWKIPQSSLDLKSALEEKEKQKLSARIFDQLLLNCHKNHDMKVKQPQNSDTPAEKKKKAQAPAIPPPGTKAMVVRKQRKNPVARVRTGLPVHSSQTIKDILGRVVTVEDLLKNAHQIRHDFFRNRFSIISYAVAKRLKHRQALLRWIEKARKYTLCLDRLRIRFDPLELPFTGLHRKFASKKQMFSFLQEWFCSADDLAELENMVTQQQLDEEDIDFIAWKNTHCYLNGKLFAALSKIHSKSKSDIMDAAKEEALKNVTDRHLAEFAEAYYIQTRIEELLDANPAISAAEVLSQVEELAGADEERKKVLTEHIEELKKLRKQ